MKELIPLLLYTLGLFDGVLMQKQNPEGDICFLCPSVSMVSGLVNRKLTVFFWKNKKF